MCIGRIDLSANARVVAGKPNVTRAILTTNHILAALSHHHNALARYRYILIA